MLEQELKKFLKDHKLVIFLCIGNVMRGDDAIGPIVARKLKVIFTKTKGFYNNKC